MSNSIFEIKKDRVIIYFVASNYFIYDYKTVMQLRLKYHICGFFVGTLPQAPQQNVFLGLPLELIPEEVAWLVDQGHAYIVDDKLRHQLYIENVTLEDVLSIKEKRIADIKRQNVEYKRNLREKSAINLLKDTSSSNLDSIISSLDNYDAEDDIPRNIVVPTKSKKSLYAMSIELSPKVKVDLSRYSVWKYLHDKGYYMTPGLKFGAHYLAYPGDPLKYHSHFLVNVMEWEQEFSIINIVGGGRLGTNVKKAWVIGANNPNTNIAHIFTVEWTGFG